MFSIKYVGPYRYLCLHDRVIAIGGRADGVGQDDVDASLEKATGFLNCASVPGSVGRGEAVMGWITADDAPCSVHYGTQEGMYTALGVTPATTMDQIESVVVRSLTQHDRCTPDNIRAAMADLASTILSQRGENEIGTSHFVALRIECAQAGQWLLVALCDLSCCEERPLPSILESQVIDGVRIAPPRREEIDTSRLTAEERAKLDRFTVGMALMACLSAMRAPGARLSSSY